MSFFPMTELLKLSKTDDWALGHFNVHNYPMIAGVVKAAEEEKAPTVLALGYQSYSHMGLKNLVNLIRSVVEDSPGRFALHIDHAKEVELIAEALRLGVSSVMFDGSALPFEENIRITSQVARMAHDVGASAEGELGVVPKPGSGKGDIAYTDPDQAAEFVQRTGIDFLAVSLGSIHGMTKASADLNQDLLVRLRPFAPLVLHGASGVTEDALRKAVSNGLRKVNINTALKVTCVDRMLQELAQNPQCDLLPLLERGSDSIRALAVKYMRLFGASGRLSL